MSLFHLSWIFMFLCFHLNHCSDVRISLTGYTSLLLLLLHIGQCWRWTHHHHHHHHHPFGGVTKNIRNVGYSPLWFNVISNYIEAITVNPLSWVVRGINTIKFMPSISTGKHFLPSLHRTLIFPEKSDIESTSLCHFFPKLMNLSYFPLTIFLSPFLPPLPFFLSCGSIC